MKIIHPGMFRTIPTPTYPEIRTVINPWKLSKHLDNIDSVHIATEGSLGMFSRILMSKHNWYYTSGFHTNFPEYINLRTGIPSKWIYPVFRWMNRRSKVVLASSNSTCQKLLEKGFQNVISWSRGFDEEIFNAQEKLPKSSKLKLLYVGRISIEKNLAKLLELSDRYDVTIVGDGPSRQEFEKHYPLAKFVGYKTGHELAKFYRAADVFVFPSLSDTFGIVMIEAMACGTPVAAYPVEGPKDAIVHGLGGYLSMNLVEAIEESSMIDSKEVLKNASKYSWKASAETFFGSLVDK